MGKTVPRLDERVTDSTRDYEWQRKESVALVSEPLMDNVTRKETYLACTSIV